MSETAFLAAAALLCMAICPRLKGILAAFGCVVIDQALQWRRIDGECMTRPIHMWLLGMYIFAMICYMSCANVVKHCKDSQSNVDCIQQVQGKSASGGMMVFATVLPICLAVWSGLGIY